MSDDDDRVGDRIRRAFDLEVPPHTSLESIRQRPQEDPGEAQAPTAGPRDRILDAATSLFYQEGIVAVAVNRIIAQADVAPSDALPAVRKQGRPGHGDPRAVERPMVASLGRRHGSPRRRPGRPL